MNYETLSEFDLLSRVYLIKTELGGRQSAVSDGYRGQFFWHINDVNCSDWDAAYYFEQGSVNPDGETSCKIILSENVKKYAKGNFPAESQFCIREGSRVVAVGVIIQSNVRPFPNKMLVG